MPHAIPIAGRVASSSSFGFVRPPGSAFPYPGYASVHHVHHHHYHHRLSPSSNPAFPPPEGVNHPYNASGRAFSSRQAWERHTAAAQATGNRPQVFDPDRYPIPHDGGDDGPVIVDADEEGVAGGMEMVLHRPFGEPRMRYYTAEADIEGQGETHRSTAATTGDSHVPPLVTSIRRLSEEPVRLAASDMYIDARSEDDSMRFDEQGNTRSVGIERESLQHGEHGQDESRDVSDGEAAAVQETHGQTTKSMCEGRTAAESEHGIGDQRRTQSLHAHRSVSAFPATANAVDNPARDRGDLAASVANENVVTPPRTVGVASYPSDSEIGRSLLTSPIQTPTAPQSNSAAHLPPTSTEMIDHLLLTTGLNARQFMRMLEDQTFVLDVERYQRGVDVDVTGGVIGRVRFLYQWSLDRKLDRAEFATAVESDRKPGADDREKLFPTAQAYTIVHIMPVLPAPPLHDKASFVVLSDWDGTITTQDSNDFLTDNLEMPWDLARRSLTAMPFSRDSFRDMLKSVADNGHNFQECQEILRKNIKLDPGFKNFYRWCKEHGVPVIIVSSGMAPIIRAVLTNLISEEEASSIDIIANDVEYLDEAKSGDKWEIVYRHPESGFGHDKSKAILPYRDLAHKPTLFFCGDGVSDMSAAKHADLLFVKEMPNGDSDLAAYCKEQGIDHVSFKDFNKVLEVVKSVVEGANTVPEVINREMKTERVRDVREAKAEVTSGME
ncbi:hypothetical protein QFC21_006441 [Naganishia friedmannii]|uniref:Uncharacterized protein n=1 Tax=Naganishia friedmannii TaxID=89922 RepID=A0ACC2V308_9TREE|nr:hypothetical protein QFC21_006441 [Naganishia friedmannii]